MAIQALSEFRPGGFDEDPILVAKIFFPTALVGLDDQDIAILGAVCRHYDRALEQHSRVELWCVGQADHRGSDEYNAGLGRDRARAVKNFLDQRLQRHSNFSSGHAISRGEAFSAQPRAGVGTRQRVAADILARDRRVNIFTSLRSDVPPQRIVVPFVQRITMRSFIDDDTQHAAPNQGEGDDENAVVMDAIVGLVTGALGLEGSLGIETERRVAMFPASDKVNEVDIDVVITFRVLSTGQRTTTRTTLSYSWGPPRPHVIVRGREHVEFIGIPGMRNTDRRQRRVISRREADSTPFVFPPNPTRRSSGR